MSDNDSVVLAMGILRGNVSNVEALVHLGATISERHRWTLYQACLVGSDMMKALLVSPEICSNICDPDESGDAILHFVLRTPCTRFSTSKMQVVQLLLEHGADLFQPDRLGETSLHILAAMSGEEEVQIFRTILFSSRPVPCLDHQNHYGDTALIVASICGHLEAARLLLSVGADPNIMGEDGMVAAQYAYQQGNLGMLDLLQEYGAETGEGMALD